MNEPRLLAVDHHLGIGHGTLEHNFYHLAFPCLRDTKAVLICAGSVGLGQQVAPIVSVVIHAKSLGFPVGRNRNDGLLSTLSAAVDLELPVHGIIFIGTRKVKGFGGLGEGNIDNSQC